MSEDVYLVWSNEHMAWWSGHFGYTKNIAEACRYNRVEAVSICAAAMPGTAARLGLLPELPVRLADIETMLVVDLEREK